MNLSLEKLKLLDFMCTRESPWTMIAGAPIESLEALGLVERHPLAQVKWRATVLGLKTWSEHGTIQEHDRMRAAGQRRGYFYVWAAYTSAIDTLTPSFALEGGASS